MGCIELRVPYMSLGCKELSPLPDDMHRPFSEGHIFERRFSRVHPDTDRQFFRQPEKEGREFPEVHAELPTLIFGIMTKMIPKQHG